MRLRGQSLKNYKKYSSFRNVTNEGTESADHAIRATVCTDGDREFR
jgi:hypothetical protein